MNNFANQYPTSNAEPEKAIPSTINPISDNPTVDTTREWSPRRDAINTTRPMTISRILTALSRNQFPTPPVSTATGAAT